MFSALAVVGFAGALVAPTGVALAEPVKAEAPDSVYSLALADTQNLTVTVNGAAITPVERGTFEVYVKPKPPPPPVVASTGSSGSSAPRAALAPYTGGGAPAEWMAAAGIAESDWQFVNYIVSRESGWNPNATNRSSGACGLVQALPCSKVPGNGYNPVDNLRWGTGYATGRYGSWEGAYNFWTKNHWW
ncbi:MULTISPECIES: transglycosylase SLT domain-containing protein [unclassified Microbacterium]|uniref:aggregation-promoting factor C-terminal-like domain-containing protein n=1 Tax=unclassified Microbacterium TaxID=2609290 RepID=UPI003017E0D6